MHSLSVAPCGSAETKASDAARDKDAVKPNQEQSEWRPRVRNVVGRVEELVAVGVCALEDPFDYYGIRAIGRAPAVCALVHSLSRRGRV